MIFLNTLFGAIVLLGSYLNGFYAFSGKSLLNSVSDNYNSLLFY